MATILAISSKNGYSILEMLQRIVQLHYLVVEEAFQGQGIGSRLLENACSLIKEAGGDYILFRCIAGFEDKICLAGGNRTGLGILFFLLAARKKDACCDCRYRLKYIVDFHNANPLKVNS